MEPLFYRKVLQNGMTVLFEKRENPVVSVAFAVRCGGINESESNKGISHFIEHLLYKGTPKRNSKKIAEEIEKKGGELNGFTDESITAYHCKMPSKHLETALEVLSDMIKNPLFEPEEIKKERQVIFEEIKMYQDSPPRYVLQEIQKFLYKPPFGIPLIGTTDTLNSITRGDIIKRFKEVYQPNNMILCVVGNADFNQIVDFAEKNFVKNEGQVPVYNIEIMNNSKIEKRKGIDQANFALAYHIPSSKDKKNYAAIVLGVLMGGGMSSRLFQEIRDKRNLAYAVRAQLEVNKDFAYSLIYVGTKKEKVEECRRVILDEFEKISKELTEEEFSQVKEQIIGNHYISCEDSHNQLANLLHYEINGNIEEFYEFEKNIRDVKIEDVKEIAKIPLEKNSFFALVPD
ncbi:insulinase family protein [Patescibacteria group bacterium]|nr:insulinase family protein [Patescibacteria group bacterium]